MSSTPTPATLYQRLTDPTTPPPRRGSRDYYSLIYLTAENTSDREAFAKTAQGLWELYGPRAAVDVMCEHVCVLEFLTPDKLRDLTGIPNIDRWTANRMDDANRMKMVMDVVQHQVAEHGAAPHEVFGKAMDDINQVADSLLAWIPVIKNALRAAHTHHRRDPVRAALMRGPGMKERDLKQVHPAMINLHALATMPMQAAKELGATVRPPDTDWLDTDTGVLPEMILTDLEEGTPHVHLT